MNVETVLSDDGVRLKYAYLWVAPTAVCLYF